LVYYNTTSQMLPQFRTTVLNYYYF